MKDSKSINTIITDASCFILLDKIGCLAFLNEIYGNVFTTPEVAAEYGKRLPNWVHVQAVNDRDLLYTYAEVVDIGEASAIALANEVISPSLILDDLKGRKLAKSLNLEFTGTVGVLVLAKEVGLIPLLKPYFDMVKGTNFRIPHNLLQILIDKYDKI
ncbi:MAG: DUF3368 domain-containing protein [Mucilaginibacter sp.]|uniref:DUF3368 domain-containing protein n=1 Tax=Mucilaginibacter sp. TaxID=1882438 RepID=UPI003263A985